MDSLKSSQITGSIRLPLKDDKIKKITSNKLFNRLIMKREGLADNDDKLLTSAGEQINEKYRNFSSATMHRQLTFDLADKTGIKAYSKSVFASVLLADISGFTRLSARLSAEELKMHINEYFSLLLNVVKANFGDVVKFLGDAVLIIWPVANDSSESVKSAAVLMASFCALQLLQDCGEYDRGEGENAVSLRLHCGIGVGTVHCMCLGENDRWEYLVTGEPLQQMGKAESEASTGEVCLSPEAFRRVSNDLEATPMPQGNFKLTGSFHKSELQHERVVSPEFKWSESDQETTSQSPAIPITTKADEKFSNSQTTTLMHSPDKANSSTITPTYMEDIDQPQNNFQQSASGDNNIDNANQIISGPIILNEDSPTKVDSHRRSISVSLENEGGKSTEADIITSIILSQQRASELPPLTKKKTEESKNEIVNNYNRKLAPLNDVNGKHPHSLTPIILNGSHAKLSMISPSTSTTTSPRANISQPNGSGFRSRSIPTDSELKPIQDRLSTKRGGDDNGTDTENKESKSNNSSVLPVRRSSDVAVAVGLESPKGKSKGNTPPSPTKRSSFTKKNRTAPMPNSPSTPTQGSHTKAPLNQEEDDDDEAMPAAHHEGALLLNCSTPSTQKDTKGNTHHQHYYMFREMPSFFGLFRKPSTHKDKGEGKGEGKGEDKTEEVAPPAAINAANISLKIKLPFQRQTSGDGGRERSPSVASNVTVACHCNRQHVNAILQNDPSVLIAKEYLSGYLKTPTLNSICLHCNPNPTMSQKDIGQSLHQMTERPKNTRECRCPLDPGVAQVLRTFVHDAARTALENQNDAYLSELRNVVTLFVELLGLDDDLRNGILLRPQKVIVSVLYCLHRYGGSLRQYVVDDKGCVIIIAFGLPGSSHEDNASRAVETAVAIRTLLRPIKVQCRQGIAEGRVYCGLVGAEDSRCEYAMMGCSVNLAARLMGKCQPDEILVNDSVHQMSEDFFFFDELPRVEAKGYAQPVAVFRPMDRKLHKGLLVNHSVNDSGFIGRSDDLRLLSAALRKLGGTATAATSTDVISGSNSSLTIDKLPKSPLTTSHIFLLEGSAGVGKTRLVAEALRVVSADKSLVLRPLVCTGTATHQFTSYHVIQLLLVSIMDLKLRKKEKKSRRPSPNPTNISTTVTKANNGKNTGLVRRQSFTLVRQMSASTNLMSKGSAVAPPTNIVTSSASVADPLEEDISVFMSIINWLSLHASRQTLDESNIFSLNEGYLISSGERDVDLNVLFAAANLKDKSNNHRSNKTINGSSSKSNIDMLRHESGEAEEDTDEFGEEPPSASVMRHDHSLEDLVPLIGQILSCRFSDSQLTNGFRGGTRTRLMESLLVRILLIAMSTDYDLLMIDNLQWIDACSLRVITRLVRSLNRGVFIGITRTISTLSATVERSGTAESPVCSKLLTALSLLGKHMKLGPLSIADIRLMIERTVGQELLTSHPEILSPQNVGELFSRAGGSPFHAMVLAQELQKALLAGKFTGVRDLPTGARNIILARFDQLSNIEQTILKTASVIGAKFSRDALQYTLIRMGSSNSANQLDRGLMKLVEFSLILPVEGNSLDTYSFSDVSVQESVYNLMLGNLKESVHAVMGEYLELFVRGDVDRMNDMVFHYIRSDNVPKKIQFLNYAAENSKEKREFDDAYKYYGQLVHLATGYDIEDLFVYCCRIFAVTESESILRRMARQSSTLLDRGKFAEDNKDSDDNSPPSKVNSPSKDSASNMRLRMKKLSSVSPFRKCFIDPSDIIRRFPIVTNNQTTTPAAAANTTTTTTLCYTNVVVWVANMSTCQLMLGNIPESHNLSQLCFYNLAIALPKRTTAGRRKSRYRSRSSITSSTSRLTFRSMTLFSTAIQYNAQSVREQLRLIETETSILLLRGFPALASDLVETGLRVIQRDSKIVKAPLFFGLVDDTEEEKNIIAPQRNKAWEKDMRKVKVRLQLILSISYMGSSCSTRSKQRAISLYNKFSEHEKGELADDPVVLLCRAVYLSSTAAFGTCCRLLEIASEAALHDSSVGHLRSASLLFKGWVSLFRGSPKDASEAVEQLLIVLSTSSQGCLHIWVMELEIMLKAIAYDFDGVHTACEKMKRLQRKVGYGATSAAVMAFSLCREEKYADASDLALYACRKLSDRMQGTMIGGFFLFCALYSALDIMEFIPSGAIAPAPETGSCLRAKPQLTSRLPKTKLGVAVKESYEALEALSQKFPCMLLLHLSIMARIGRLYGDAASPDVLNEIDGRMKSNKHNINEFCWGYGYMHLQRALLCRRLGLSSVFMKHHDSWSLARKYFRKMGVSPSELIDQQH